MGALGLWECKACAITKAAGGPGLGSARAGGEESGARKAVREG